MPRSHRLGRLSTAILLVFTTTILQASPAAACSCGPLPEDQYAMFIGTVTHRESDPPVSEPMDVQFSVDQVLTGRAGPKERASVIVGSDSSCGFPLNIEVGGQYLVKGRMDPPGTPEEPMAVNTCGGQLARLALSSESRSQDVIPWSWWEALAGAAVGASAVLVLSRQSLLGRYRRDR